MKEKLESGRFRWINEQLYTTTGDKSMKIFHESPELFEIYHIGFRNQVDLWPMNPVDIYITYLNTKPKNWIIADFGCGEAKIAQNVKQKVHSFDFVEYNEYITACDMSHVPLDDMSVNCAIFCLSLMGTNLVQYLKEAFRILKLGGELKIAEVKSRFDDTESFKNLLVEIGFQYISIDNSNTMFVLFNFKKEETDINNKVRNYKLKPCRYKKR